MADVVTLGECMSVLYPPVPIALDHAPTLLLDIGGAETNLAIQLQHLGHTACFISRVGDDPFGRRISQTLTTHGVDASFVKVDSTAPTGVFFREWLPDGARRVYYYRANSAASRLSPDDLQPEAFVGARIVHLTGITPALSPSCAATVVRAIEIARDVGAHVSFDPNYRARLWDAETARAALLPLIEQTDILLMGHEDALAILGTDDAATAMAHAAALGPDIVVFKQGERGASVLANGETIHVPAHPVETLIDPVGAGDAFNAGFLAGVLRAYSLEECLQLGVRLGAAAAGALGDYAGYSVNS